MLPVRCVFNAIQIRDPCYHNSLLHFKICLFLLMFYNCLFVFFFVTKWVPSIQEIHVFYLRKVFWRNFKSNFPLSFFFSISFCSSCYSDLDLVIPDFFFFVFFFSRSPPAEGGSQARHWSGATSAGLHYNHSNAKSGLCLWPTPQLMAMLDPQRTEWGQGSNLHPHGC